MDQGTSSGNKGLPMSMLALGAAVIIAAGAIWYINSNSQKEMAKLPKEEAAATAQAEPTSAMMKDTAMGDAMASNSTMMKKRVL